MDAGALNAVLGDGMSSRLFLSVREERGLAYDISSGLVDYADAGALEVSAGVDPASLRDALKAILVELARLRDEPVPPEELDKAKRYLSGGLELRMDETRHVASWIGGQEALHDRVLTVDEALVAIDAVTRRRHPALAGDAARRRRTCGWPRSLLRATCAASTAICACPHDGRHDRVDAASARPGPRAGPPPPRLAVPRRAELETLAGRDMLDAEGVVDLAEARWRTGDIAGAGEAAAVVLDDDDGPVLALVVAAEAAAARGRPTEARRLAARRWRPPTAPSMRIFAGMPRSPAWPPDPAAPPPVADDDVRHAPRRVWSRGQRGPSSHGPRVNGARRRRRPRPRTPRRSACGTRALPPKPRRRPRHKPRSMRRCRPVDEALDEGRARSRRAT